jgi:hypothetical protein
MLEDPGWGMRGNGSLAVDVVTAVAAAKNVPPAAVDVPLNDVVDVDALERLVSGDETTVSFEYAGCEVTVDGDGEVTVRVVDAPR